MNGVASSGYSLALVGSQHRDLVHRVEETRRLLAETVDERKLAEAFVQAQTELGQLQGQMDYHFLVEAAGGYLEEAVSRLPRLAPDVTRLERQHSQLMSEVESLKDLAGDSAISPPAWRRLREAYEAFARRMLQHESAECCILQEGFDDDSAAFD